MSDIEFEHIEEIFDRITERYENPVQIGGRCESHVYYRVEYLTESDLNDCAEYVANRIRKVVAPAKPEVFLKLAGGYSFFAERLCAVYAEMFNKGQELPLEHYSESKLVNSYSRTYQGKSAILVTDVITTARSSLEAHTKATLKGINVLCWSTLIDRTFGPGPVPVVSALTGDPVRVLTQVG